MNFSQSEDWSSQNIVYVCRLFLESQDSEHLPRQYQIRPCIRVITTQCPFTYLHLSPMIDEHISAHSITLRIKPAEYFSQHLLKIKLSSAIPAVKLMKIRFGLAKCASDLYHPLIQDMNTPVFYETKPKNFKQFQLSLCFQNRVSGDFWKLMSGNFEGSAFQGHICEALQGR